MLWGLWMDAERVGPQSHVAREHPEWVAMAYDDQRRLNGLLDITQPAAARLSQEKKPASCNIETSTNIPASRPRVSQLM